MKKVFFANPLLSRLLLEEDPEIKDFLIESISEDFKLILEPFKKISLNEEKVFLFIIEPTKLAPFSKKVSTESSSGHGYINMDTFLSKLDQFGFKVFKPDMVKEVLFNISFTVIDAVKFEVIILTDAPYVHETKTELLIARFFYFATFTASSNLIERSLEPPSVPSVTP